MRTRQMKVEGRKVWVKKMRYLPQVNAVVTMVTKWSTKSTQPHWRWSIHQKEKVMTRKHHKWHHLVRPAPLAAAALGRNGPKL